MLVPPEKMMVGNSLTTHFQRHIRPKAGKVYLVGAGPGDPRLLTLRGLELLKKADVVIYDRLISKSILKFIPTRTRKIFVGKSPGKHQFHQESINRLMMTEASKGNTVVRLKGGDPFIFGRGGEEAQALCKTSISFEFVPGVPSASAVPAYAGIPLTHRDYSSSVAIATGHEGHGKEGRPVNWEMIAKSVDTLVILMGVSSLSSIISDVIRGGRREDTPVAIIENGMTRSQRVTVGTLRDIVTKARKVRVRSPAVVVIGEVVNLRGELAWLKLPA